MRIHLPWALALLAGALLGLPRLPAARDEAASSESFSAGRAARYVEAWAAKPRPTGSEEHAQVLDGIDAELRSFGYHVTRERSGALVNLVARAPGGPERGGVWLVAHTDSVPQAPGAADDGLGLAVLVESARALAQSGPPQGLHLLFTDAEERGLLGAKAHVALRADAEPRLVINVEARGTEGPAYMFQTAGPTGPLARALNDGCSAQATSLARAVYELLPNDTDFTVFRGAGFLGYDLALIGGAWRYHTPLDRPEHLDPRSVQQVGDCVLALARHWLAQPLPSGSAPAAYAQLAGHTVVAPTWALRLAGLVLLVGAARGLRWRGALYWGAVGGLAAVLGVLALVGLVALWPPFLALTAEVRAPHWLWWLATALGLGCLPLVARGPFAMRRDTLGGALSAWAAGAGLLALAWPEVGYVALPAGVASVLLVHERTRWAAVPALVAGLLLAPLVVALPVALTTRLLPALVVAPPLLLGWAVLPALRRSP